ncbi:hypothetical protein AB1Y20_011324 [Prymnesium parvum]|uniref:Uncharacterized protein n=1 Tax=Prymnesium parvum TaxID=97485 RepID=A0AB34INJ5_PRYPA
MRHRLVLTPQPTSPRPLELGPDLLKSLLLRHVRHCHSSRCATCAKLRTRIAAVKRRRALWRTFRAIARVAGVLALSRRRAACRVYAPGGVGYLQMEEEFEAMQREAKGAAVEKAEAAQREAKGAAIAEEVEAMPRGSEGAAMEEVEAIQREAKRARCGPSRRS